jgi:hypothetical protein
MHVRGNSKILITGGAPRRALGNPSVKLWREKKIENGIRIGKLGTWYATKKTYSSKLLYWSKTVIARDVY